MMDINEIIPLPQLCASPSQPYPRKVRSNPIHFLPDPVAPSLGSGRVISGKGPGIGTYQSFSLLAHHNPDAVQCNL